MNGSDINQLFRHPNIFFNNATRYLSLRLWIQKVLLTYSSVGGFNRLCSAVTNNDCMTLLPRVYFCSLVWTTPGLQHVHDHKFTLLKHTNDNYQMLQGYVAQENTSSDGFGLREWQLSGNRYASCNGFSLLEMNSFFEYLSGFASNDAFDDIGYNAMFGVSLPGGGSYWPTISHTELQDSDIVGSGYRQMADSMEEEINIIR